jgi:hypothetical protein
MSIISLGIIAYMRHLQRAAGAESDVERVGRAMNVKARIVRYIILLESARFKPEWSVVRYVM